MTSRFDDLAGVQQTYYFLSPRRGASQVAGSSMLFIVAVNSALLGLLAAITTGLLGGTLLAGSIVGAAIGIVFLAASLAFGGRLFYGFWKTHVPLHPTPHA